MLAYIALFFLLSCFFGFFLMAVFIIKCFGLVPLAKRIITKLFSNNYDQKFNQQAQSPINTDCYICLQRTMLEVVTTCNHSYCSKCILDYVQSKRDAQIKCPACRKQICILLRRFQPRNSVEKQLKMRIAQFNCMNSKQIGFFRAIMQFTNIFKHLGMLFSVQGLKFMLESPRIRNILLLLVYSLSPIDLLPEMFLGPLGLIDDTYASLELLRQFSNLWIQFVRDQAQRQRLND